MSSVRSFLQYFKFGTGRTKKVAMKNMMNSIFITTRILGSINFFLNGKVVVKDVNGKVQHMVVPFENDINNTLSNYYARDPSNIVGQILRSYNKQAELADEHPFHQELNFRKSLEKLREKADTMCER